MEFVLGVLASLVAAAIFPSITSGIASALVRTLSWLPIQAKVDLSGHWESTWEVDSGRFPERVSCTDVLVKQLRRRFYARFRVGAVDFSALGEIEAGRYVTGYWRDRTEGGYHGAFQLLVDPNSREMTGLWIGYSTAGIVKHGVWEWRRPQTSGASGVAASA